jgi:glutathione synthase/RimK-type ligase-like ATP-grasp enzyme
MRDGILILSGPDDAHAFSVAEGVRRKGGRATIWHTGDFPVASYESLEYDDGLHLGIRGAHQVLSDPAPAVVWNRRVGQTFDVSALHPADRTFGSGQCLDLRRSMVHLVGEGAFWVNSPLAQARAILKPVQLRAAQRAGFEIPRTLCSNDPERIRAFVRRCGGAVVFKQLALVGVWADGENRYAPYTTTVREDQLGDDPRTAAAPGIFQEIIPRVCELRVTAIGNRLFTTRLDLPQDEDAKIDWRLEILKGGTKMRAASIPRPVEESIHAYLRDLGLVFGCFDILVTPDERYLFLECNEMGQFLFVEDETDVPILDAFITFLLQATPQFDWRETADSLRLRDLRPAVGWQMKAAMQVHTIARRPRFQEASGEPADRS